MNERGQSKMGGWLKIDRRGCRNCSPSENTKIESGDEPKMTTAHTTQPQASIAGPRVRRSVQSSRRGQGGILRRIWECVSLVEIGVVDVRDEPEGG